MTKGYAFSRDNAERILRATEAVERRTQNTSHGSPRAKVVTVGFFAKLTDKSTTGKYSWKAVLPNDSYDMTAASDQWEGKHTDSTGWAYNVPYKSKDVPKEEIVWLTGSKKHNVFQFEYSPGVKIGRTTTSISKRYGSSPGSGTVMLQKVDSTSHSISDHETVKVYNSFQTTVEKDQRVHITFGEGGLWWVTGVDCDVEDST